MNQGLTLECAWSGCLLFPAISVIIKDQVSVVWTLARRCSGMCWLEKYRAKSDESPYSIKVSWQESMAGAITALEPQKKNAERVNVYIEGTFAFGISAIDAVRLRVGQMLSDAEIEALRQGDQGVRAYERAVRLLSHRARSAEEIRQALSKAEVPADVIENTLTRLIDHGYVDDLAFAQAWVADRQAFHPLSTRALRYELRRKGIADAITDQVLSTLDQAEAAFRAVRTQAKRLKGLDRRGVYNRLVPFLARRGFDYDTARAAIEQLLQELEAQGGAGLDRGGGDDADFD